MEYLNASASPYRLRPKWQRLALPTRVATWSLTSLQQRLMKTGGQLIKHARYYWLLLAESHVWTCVWRIADLCRKSVIRHTRQDPGGRGCCAPLRW
jgi:hypothetical protein